MSKIPKVLQSSANPENVSVTWQSLALGVVPVAVFLFELKGIPVTEVGLIDVINNVTILIVQGGVVFGGIRKIYYKVVNSFKK